MSLSVYFSTLDLQRAVSPRPCNKGAPLFIAAACCYKPPRIFSLHVIEDDCFSCFTYFSFYFNGRLFMLLFILILSAYCWHLLGAKGDIALQRAPHSAECDKGGSSPPLTPSQAGVSLTTCLVLLLGICSFYSVSLPVKNFTERSMLSFELPQSASFPVFL